MSDILVVPYQMTPIKEQQIGIYAQCNQPCKCNSPKCGGCGK